MPDSFFQSGNSSQAQSSGTNAPWAAQQPYLTQGMQAASDIYNQQKNTPFYQGELYSSLNPTQLGAMSGLNNFASGAGANTADTLTNAGNSAVGGVGQAATNAGSLYGTATSDPTQRIISDASQYANNPQTQAMITAANRPVEQNLTENALPQAQLQAAATGGAGNSRLGTQSAIMRRDATNQESDNAANIMGAQYNNGINTASSNYNNSLNAGLNANGQLLNAGAQGASLLGQGYNTSLTNQSIPLQTGTLQQQDANSQDQANYAQWQGQQAQPWSTLNNYWGVVDKGLLGNETSGTSTGQTTNTPSGIQDFGSVLGLISDPRAKIIDGQDGSSVDPAAQSELQGEIAKAPDYQSQLNAPSDNFSWDSFLKNILNQTSSATPSQNPAPQAAIQPAPMAQAPAAPQSIAPAKTGSIMGIMGGMMGGGGGGGMLSDPRVKVVGGETEGALSAVSKIGLKKARYKWDAPGTDRPMMMADQVQKVLPHAVTGKPGGAQVQTIKIGDMLPVMIGAIKELNKKVNRKAA